MSDLVHGLPPLNELFNVAHARPYSLLLVNYSFALGLAGGMAVIWAVAAWLGRRETPGFRFAMPLVVGLIVAGFMSVLAEVQQPGRLIYGYLHGWTYIDTAIIKYGIFLLPLFLALSWWLMFQAVERERLERGIEENVPAPLRPLVRFVTLWSWRYGLLDIPVLGRLVLVALVLLGLFAQAYSGIFLMNEHGVPLWNSPAQVILFVVTGIGGGAALFVFAVPFLHWLATGAWHRPGGHYRWVMLASALFAILVGYAWMWWIHYFGDIENQRAAALLWGPYFPTIVWHVAVVGLVMPAIVLLTPLGRLVVADIVAGFAILWGAWALRYLVLLGGQALNRSGAGYLAFEPNAEVYWYTGVEALLGIALAVLLGMLLPVGTPGPATATRTGGH